MKHHWILIVEDNELNREILKESLADQYQILEAANGQEALDILKQNKDRISLILLDIMMPVMDGYAFLDIIKKDPELSLIPVIVTTQGQSEEEELAALKHGATDFVPKPYRPQIISHRMESLITLRESAAMANQFKFDRLTGLYSKEYFYSKARQCLDAHPEKEYTILCCNLENFKLYNDTFGRKAGDQLIIDEAKLFRRSVGEESICARYNADRFLALVEKGQEITSREHCLNARKANRQEPLANISLKVGIYEIIDRSISVEQMCDRALWVVETIKGNYNQHLAVYDDTLRNKLLREQQITDAIGQALAENQFTVYYQPKYRLSDGCLVGAEALVRWIHPEWGFVSPGDFIPLFEKNGFVSQLDGYVWERVCGKLRDWRQKGYPPVPVSVNVSRADIYQSQLVQAFLGFLTQYGIDPSLLHLEITESAYTESPDQIISMVAKLREHGFIIEMDDFGSGYSSLNMLSQMSLDVLKLDMQFVRNELSKPLDESLLQDVVNMAHRIHLHVIAEGVETKEQAQCLQEMGCDYAQGYYFAKPMKEADFEELLQKIQCAPA